MDYSCKLVQGKNTMHSVSAVDCDTKQGGAGTFLVIGDDGYNSRLFLN